MDQSPAPALSIRSEPAGPRNNKLAASLTLGGLYAGFATWTYFAWYRQHKPLAEFRWGGDGNWKVWNDREGWFGSRRYSAGADKLGHAWATYVFGRGGTELLVQWGGFDRLPATLVASGLAELLFFSVEIKDGFYYEFSYGDFVFNTLGAGLSVAMSLSPRLDELIDYRVQYWPSQAYVDQLAGGNVNIAEDYTGQTYLLAFHLGGIHALRDHKYGVLARFLDVAVGYGSNGYKPEPPQGFPKYRESKHSYIGISLNAQGLFDWLFEKRAPRARKLTHGMFEVFNAPYGFIPAIDHETLPMGEVAGGGA
ncbi:MAG: DUF2279 domain-containing protein [Deltaproteobacteria bacterium]|nr:DUF2279 domain-containing protein [Deltaproteobacteria bacterium]